MRFITVSKGYKQSTSQQGYEGMEGGFKGREY